MEQSASEATAVEIVRFEDEHAEAFARLNRAWLIRYDLLEEGDRKQLERPRESILAGGGEIFVALVEGVVVGTCAAIVRDADTVELAKLAVADGATGRGIGRSLTLEAIAWARARGANRVVLVSSTRLTSALRLYERLGFAYRSLPADPGYATADIYMELDL
jgi:GNAT superfamily N-acetyltransferase